MFMFIVFFFLVVTVPPQGPFIDGRSPKDTTLFEYKVIADKVQYIECHAINGKPVASLTWTKGFFLSFF